MCLFKNAQDLSIGLGLNMTDYHAVIRRHSQAVTVKDSLWALLASWRIQLFVNDKNQVSFPDAL